MTLSFILVAEEVGFVIIFFLLNGSEPTFWCHINSVSSVPFIYETETWDFLLYVVDLYVRFIEQ